MGGTCPDGSGIPWYWGSDGRARAGGCSAAASIAPTTTAPATTTTAVSATTVAPVVVPGTPATPTGVAGNTQVTGSVTAGSGGTPTSYTITQSTTSGGTYSAGCTVTGASGSCVVTGLTNGTTYFFKTTATNSAGTSSLSSASSSVTPATVPGTPATPTGVAGNAQVTVSVAAGTGGTPTSYTVTQATTSGGVYSTGCTVTVPASSCVVTGLTNDTPYFFKTTATNSVGTSGLSVASTSVTPVATCATGGTCVVGNTGPGGGLVFYVASNFTSTGSDCNTTCKYLEAAPVGWGNGITVVAGETTGTSTADPRLYWCSNTSTLRNATSKSAIGDGRPNTATGTEAGWAACTSGAIFQAELYAGGGKTDWHLPSFSELGQMNSQRTLISTTLCCYTSSTEVSATLIKHYNMSDGGSGGYGKASAGYYQRPIRAFG